MTRRPRHRPPAPRRRRPWVAPPLAAAALAAALAGPAPAAPLPLPKPEAAVAPAPAVPAPVRFDEAAVGAMRTALSLLDLNDLDGARAAVADRTDLERDVVTWLAIRRQVSGLSADEIAAFAARKPHWPNAGVMRRRAEQAIARADLPPRDVIAAFGPDTPLTEEGVLALARAQVALGRTAAATKLLGPFWAREVLTPERQKAVLDEFGALLTKADHKARYDTLMYADRIDQALDLAPLVGEGWADLAAARRAVLRETRDAEKKLDLVTGEARQDPLHAFTRAEFHRRADRDVEAADALLSVPAEKTRAHPDAWWVERRIVSRGVLEHGDFGRAYEIVAMHAGGDAETVAEAHFHAGWYALRFLKDPGKARPHFEALQKAVTLPISRARAAYWLGRTEEAAGRVEEARRHYTVAAADEATFYGQLARVKLGMDRLDMPPEPEPTDADRVAYRENDMAQSHALLVQSGASGDALALAMELARQLPSGGQLAILAGYLTALGDHRAALQVGKLAADRNLGTERLAFPLEALPESGRSQKQVETAMVYAIARQESAFDPGAVSHAGAMGLLQLLPGTAQQTARSLGMPFSRPRLTTDADYNATLGAAHLRELVDRFGGSYILTFAAYNAGPRRADEWIERFGDPRSPDVDPIDWIELIPFGETRSYVQRVTENLQVYRERLDDAKLGIADDLRRGGDT